MKREAVVSFVIVVLFLVSAFPRSNFSRAADSYGGLGFPGAPPTIDWWPTFHHDLNHTGYSKSAAPITNQTLWNYTSNLADDYVFSSPAVVDGKVYVGSGRDNVTALDASTGDKLWNYTTNGTVKSSPAVAGGIVYVGSEDQNVYALNASTGHQIWNYTTGGYVDSSPVVAGGMVYFGSNDNRTYCLNATTSTQIWNFTTNDVVFSSPAVAGGIVYVGSEDQNVYALNASTGHQIWNYTTGGRVFSSPAVVDGKVFVGSGDGNVTALDASTGDKIWNYTTGDPVESSPAVAGGIVYVGSEDQNVYALNASTGHQIWNYTTGDPVRSSPAVAGGIVYVGSSDGNVYALNASTNALVWSYTNLSAVYSSPAVVDGTAFVGSMDNHVYAFGPPRYDVAIAAHCVTEGIDVNVSIAKDGSPTGNTTRHNFTGLTGTHTFTVPDTDAAGHPFKQWSTGETDTTVTVTSRGNYTACYEEMWPMFHHDLSHTGYSTSPAPNANSTLWNYTTFGRVRSSPAVADGKVYVGSDDNRTYCLNAITGTQIWNYTTGGSVDSSPAVADGKVYVGSWDGKVYGLNASTGAPVWNYTTGFAVESSPAVAGGIVYVGSDDGNVTALSASTGDKIWNYTTGGRVFSSPAVADGKVYVGSWDGNLYALNASTGHQIWNCTTGGLVESSPAVLGDRVFAGSDKVYALNASTGDKIWNYTTGHFDYYVDSSPAVADGKVYVGSDDGNVYALDASTGAYVWNYTTDDLVWSSPAVADGKVYVGSWDGNLYALNASTDALVWSYATSLKVESSPAVADGKVYVGSDDGNVYAFGIHDVAVTNVTSKDVVCQGYCCNVTVAVANHGHYSETFNVTAYCTNSSVLTGFKKPITITERSGNTLTDYQVLLTMDTASLISAGKMRPNCGDIRFKDSAGSEIPYWIESGVNSSNTRIWVRVPSIPSSGNTTIYMWYGNLTANSVSNGTATFCFFDDFGSLDTTNVWNVTTSGNAKASVSNGELVLSAAGSSQSGDSVWVTLKRAWNGSYIIGARARNQSDLGDSGTGIIWRVNESGNWSGNEHWVYQCYYNGSGDAYLSMSNDTGFNGPSLTDVPISSTGVVGYIKRDYLGKNYYSVVDGTQQAGLLNEVADGSWTIVQNTNKIGISANNYNHVPTFDFRYDWFFVSKYVSQEPIISVGEEEPAQEIASQTVILSGGNSAAITFKWNTTGFPKGNYTLSAYACPVPSETNTADNSRNGSKTIIVAIVGDIRGPDPWPDGTCDMRDIRMVAESFGANLVTDPNSPKCGQYWHPTPIKGDPCSPNCDINNDGTIDMKDIRIAAKSFGKTDP